MPAILWVLELLLLFLTFCNHFYPELNGIGFWGLEDRSRETEANANPTNKSSMKNKLFEIDHLTQSATYSG